MNIKLMIECIRLREFAHLDHDAPVLEETVLSDGSRNLNKWSQVIL